MRLIIAFVLPRPPHPLRSRHLPPLGCLRSSPQFGVIVRVIPDITPAAGDAADREAERRVGEELSLRERARSRDPVPLNLYRVACRLERLTPEQALRVADGLDVLSELLEDASVKGMTVRAAVDAGLITEADYWGAFGMAPPE